MSPFRPNGHLPNVQKTKEKDIMIATLAVKGANAINLSMTWHNNDDFSNVEMDFFVSAMAKVVVNELLHPTLRRSEKRGTPLFHSYYRLATQIKHFKYLFGFRCGIV